MATWIKLAHLVLAEKVYGSTGTDHWVALSRRLVCQLSMSSQHEAYIPGKAYELWLSVIIYLSNCRPEP